jgi:sulfonate dioxygenase
MAPSLEEPVTGSRPFTEPKSASSYSAKKTVSRTYEPGKTLVEDHEYYEHEDLSPSFPTLFWEPLEEVPYHDKGLEGSEDFHYLLDAATDVFDSNPKIGTEIHGIQLSQLTDSQKNDLARLVATRGVVFFRNQEDFDIQKQRELGQYFGKLHKHATTSVPKKTGLEDVHVVYADENSKDPRAFFTPTFLWHSDVGNHLQISGSH